MPSIFKALASISAWVLFVFGMLSIAWSIVDPLVRGGGISGELYHFNDVVWATLSVLCVFLSVVTMKIRKGLE